MHNRYDLYGPVHMGLWHALSGICLHMGSVDSSDHQKLKSIIEEWKRIVIILDVHSHDDDFHLNDVYMMYAPETETWVNNRGTFPHGGIPFVY